MADYGKAAFDLASKTKLVRGGDNKFIPATVTNDKYVNYLNGTLQDNTTYAVTDFIEIKPNTNYSRNYSHQTAFYNKDKVYISGLNASASPASSSTILTPSGAYYIRLSIAKSFVNSFSFREGSIGDNTFIDFMYDGYNLLRAKPSKNLFNKNTAVANNYVNSNFGGLQANTSYYASDFIEVAPSQTYTRSFKHTVAFYDATKNFISGIPSTDTSSTFTTPANASYVRVTVGNDVLDSYQLEKGSSATSYKTFGFEFSAPSSDVKSDLFELFLPSEICVAVGVTIELYNSQVCWTGNINNYHFKWECAVGRAMKRKWSYKGDAAKIGSYPLTCSVYDNNMTLVASATTTVKVVNNIISTPKKILPIGDSLTNNKGWLAELISLSSSKFSFVGTRWNGDVQGGVRNHEGRSGATAGWYLTNGTYTFDSNGVGTGNPFWNPNTNKFDFAYYKTTYSINPDIVQLFLGTNGIALDPTSNATNIKGIVDGIRETDTTIPIYVVFTLYRGDQNGMGNQLSSDGYSAGSGIWKLEEDRKVYNLMVKVNELLKSYTNLYFIPISLAHDSEYNFMATTPVAVNPRSTITELQHAEATHPSARPEGYLQMADIMFSTYAAHIS